MKFQVGGATVYVNDKDPLPWAEAFAKGWYADTPLGRFIGRTVTDPETLRPLAISYEQVGLPNVPPGIAFRGQEQVVLTRANAPAPVHLREVRIAIYAPLCGGTTPVEVGGFDIRFAEIMYLNGLVRALHRLWRRDRWKKTEYIVIDRVPLAALRARATFTLARKFVRPHFLRLPLHYSDRLVYMSGDLLFFQVGDDIHYRVSRIQVTDIAPDVQEPCETEVYVNPSQKERVWSRTFTG